MKEKIRDLIGKFVRDYKIEMGTETDWRKPLVAFADAADPLFLELKGAVSETHLLPQDLLEGARTVITYFIPFREETVKSNAKRGASSREWATAYVETNIMITQINRYVSDELKKIDIRSAVVPATKYFDEKKLISNWSHRHAAFIAGLGKFGLNRMLITEMGCAGRVGSIVTSAEIPPTKRIDREFCLYKNDLGCKKCVENCTFGALTANSFDRHRCYEVCLTNAKKYQNFTEVVDVCGKCLALVPCSFKKPAG